MPVPVASLPWQVWQWTAKRRAPAFTDAVTESSAPNPSPSPVARYPHHTPTPSAAARSTAETHTVRFISPPAYPSARPG